MFHKTSLGFFFTDLCKAGGRLLKSSKYSCTLRSPERDAQASNQNMGHINEPGARAADKGTPAPLEEHLSRFYLHTRGEEAAHLNSHLLTDLLVCL